ncbi:MAG: phosphotransferase [Clostridia bacterium]|nr:phosphotransferase [Clostridia bacterium]
MDADIVRIFSLFSDAAPSDAQVIETSRGDRDFRAAVIVKTGPGPGYVLKLADNDFTFPDKIAVWQRTAEEYRKLGVWCPRIFRDRTGVFPTVEFRGRRCAAYMEECSPFRPASGDLDDEKQTAAVYGRLKRDIWHMTGRVAAQHFDYSPYPSGYCLFETFCPSDRTDEVLENALAWREYAATLPEEFRERTDRIWRLWTDNRAALEKIYQSLPSSVFQADLNLTNILVDDEGAFAGVYDFNLCGRDVFLNYLMRENSASGIREALRTASEVYRFSEAEIRAAPMMYRCLKPLWYTRLKALKKLGDDRRAIAAFLEETERSLTGPLDFRADMTAEAQGGDQDAG